MKVREVMTRNVVSVGPDATVRDIARTLLTNRITAVPVVDADGHPLGIVSEADLIQHDDAEQQEHQDWWLRILAEGETLDPDFLASLRPLQATAREVMAAPLVTVTEDADLREIARLLATYRIKRVPVLREGRLVGIVSRVDVLRGLGGDAAPPSTAHAQEPGLLASGLTELDDNFNRRQPREGPEHPAERPPDAPEAGLMAADFQNLVADHEHHETLHSQEARRAAAEERRRQVAELIDHHLSDESWRSLLHQARQAAEHGAKEFMLLRFPNQLCTDGGRAINVGEGGWPSTLRGEAAEMYLRWDRDLKPQGFGLRALILEFPEGYPGDIGMFLTWGKK